MAEQDYDVAIIGSGPGGYVAGIRAGQLGLKAVCIEKGELGGVCTNWGCIPTKALLRNAEVLELIRGADAYGVTVKEVSADWATGVKRSQRVVRQSVQGITFLLKKNNVEVIKGAGALKDPTTVMVEGEGEPREVRARHVIIATGARPFVLPGVEVDGKRIITSEQAVKLPEVPKRLLIMGAGAIGMEFATVYSAYGSEVTVVEMLGQVLPTEDAEVGAALQKAMTKRGVKFHLNSPVQAIEASDSGVRMTVQRDGKNTDLEGDVVLLGAGNVGNVEGLGLDKLGVEVGRGGTIKTNEYLQTTVPTVYAIGDVIGVPRLAHKAMHEGVIAVEHMAGRNPHPMRWDNIPGCTYCHPEVASVGLTEAKAREAGHDVKVSKFPFSASGRARALGDTDGFVKFVVDARYGEILGVHMIGPEVTEIIHEVALARLNELTVEEIIATVHAHPTLSEAIHEAALGALGAPLHI